MLPEPTLLPDLSEARCSTPHWENYKSSFSQPSVHGRPSLATCRSESSRASSFVYPPSTITCRASATASSIYSPSQAFVSKLLLDAYAYSLHGLGISDYTLREFLKHRCLSFARCFAYPLSRLAHIASDHVLGSLKILSSTADLLYRCRLRIF